MSERHPLLVRIGLSYFEALHQKAPRSQEAAADAIHYLNPEERKALRQIERGAILRAAIAGALSSVVAAVVEVVIAQPLLGPRPRYATMDQSIRFYAVVGVATAIAALLEILYLYWDGLRAVHHLSRAAGLDLFPEQDDNKALAAAMARAALELPNPNTAAEVAVNPWREASRIRLFIASIVYKAKVSATNFIVKALIRRAFGRAFVRSWLPFVAVPITAAWNAWICWLIMREARIRAMGPSAIQEMTSMVFENPESDASVLSAEARAVVVRAVASSIVRTEDMHPNLLALLKDVTRRMRLEPNEAPDLDDTRAFLSALAKLSKPEQTLVLRVLSIASIVDGRLTRAERRLLREASEACGREVDLSSTERLRRAFVDGAAIQELVARI